MIEFRSFQGTITNISDFWINANNTDAGCFKLISVKDKYKGLVNFVVRPSTYFIDHAMVAIGDIITAFYDANAPVPLIFPPQYIALVVAKHSPEQNVTVDYFNNQLVSADGKLKLNLSPRTQIVLQNGQAFTRNPAGRDLIVIYGAATKSIPAQTTPYKIIVICPMC